MSELIVIKSKIINSDFSYEYNSSNDNISKHANFSMSNGTIIKVTNLFHKHNIRKNELINTFKKDVQQILELFEKYSILYNDTCFNLKILNSKGKIENIFSKPSFADSNENIYYVINNGIRNSLVNFQTICKDFGFKGYIHLSNLTGSDLKKSRYYFYVNSKPVFKIKSFVNIIKDFLNKKTIKSKILLILMINCNNDDIIGNLEKSKFKIILKNERLINESFKDILTKELESIYDNTNHKVVDFKNEIINFPLKENKIDLNNNNKNEFNNLLNNNKTNVIDDQDNLLVRESISIDIKKDSKNKLNQNSNIYTNENKIKISKTNLKNMIVLGQFNKGFIICKNIENDNIIHVVDQHASDEKFNYERQLKSLSYQKQFLAASIELKLNKVQLNICNMYKDLIYNYGFKIIIKDDSIEVLSKPCFQEKIVDTNEIFDLINYLNNDLNNKQSFVFAKINKYIVKNACRYSTMIRDTLSMNRMREIVNNMSNLDAPFNCPHGRPTIISLSHHEDSENINKYLFEL